MNSRVPARKPKSKSNSDQGQTVEADQSQIDMEPKQSDLGNNQLDLDHKQTDRGTEDNVTNNKEEQKELNKENKKEVIKTTINTIVDNNSSDLKQITIKSI